MAAIIRLSRHGAKKKPFYRIVVADRRYARDGRKIEQVGLYDPRTKPSRIEFRAERLAKWLSEGAKPSPTVAELIKRSGIDLSVTTPTVPDHSDVASDAEKGQLST
jgi:small subunit ribosomal protein S16